MSNVNPPPYIKMPDKFFSDRDLRRYFEGLEFIIFQLWKRTGGGSDAVSSAITTASLSAPAYSASNFVGQSITAASSNYTTTGLDRLVVATAAITVSLNDEPNQLEQVSIKRSSVTGPVVIDGNGNTIDGQTTYTIAENYEAIDLMYADDWGGWAIV
jgi:hypothetical protein